jgi:hypothetical protein
VARLAGVSSSCGATAFTRIPSGRRSTRAVDSTCAGLVPREGARTG